MVSMADFTFAFEMATTSTPRTASPSYTALTSFVMAGEGMTMSRGRGSEQESTAQPGRASVTLRNTDQRFTWGNGSSPYAPLQLRRPCRFRVTYSATAYDRWQGFVDEWGNDRVETTGVARLSMSDRLARAAVYQMGTQLQEAMGVGNPTYYWPLDDVGAVLPVIGSQSPSVQLGAGGVEPYYVSAPGGAGGSLTFVDATIGADVTGALALTSGSTSDDYTTLVAAIRDSATATSATFHFFFKSSTLPRFGSATILSISSSMNFYIETDGTCSIAYGGTNRATGVQVVDGKWHHVAATLSLPAGIRTAIPYLDGTAYSSVTSGSGSTVWDAVQDVYFGGQGTAQFDGQISNVAIVLGTQLTAAQIADISRARDAWTPESPTARFQRLCSFAGLPSAFYSTTGTTGVTLGAQDTSGGSLLDAFRSVAESVNGAAVVTDAGVLTLATGDSRYNTAVGLTLDATKAGQILSGSLDFRTDTDDVTNEATAARAGGPLQRALDATSIDAYDVHNVSATLPVDLDTICLNWAQWRVASHKDPRPRCESVTVDVIAYANSGGNVANLLNADIGTKLRLSNLPTDVYSTSTLDLFVEGVRDEVTKDTYRITFTTSPVALEDTVWILGTDTLGVGTILGY